METEILLSHSQNPTIGPYTKLFESRSHPYAMFF